MKSSQLKMLVKEAVKEAIQEELKEILLEAVKTPKVISQPLVAPVVENYIPPTPTQPVMSAEDKRTAYRNILGDTGSTLNSSNVQSFQPQAGMDTANGTYFTRDQIKANLVNYLLTNKGERVFKPSFGADLRSLLFENMQDVSNDDLKNTIQDDIVLYFPNVIVKEIKFNNAPDENTVNFTLIYQIVNFGIDDEINILLQ